jgi:hypothetical protein
MTEEAQPASSSEQTDSGMPAGEPAEPQEESSGASTLEEVESYWKNRVSGSDRAHAATEKALREQMAQLEQQVKALSEGKQPAADPASQRIAELERQLQETEAQKAAALRRSQYPNAAQSLGDSIANIDEATLAGLEERLAPQPPKPPTPKANNPPRQAGTPTGKPLSEMTADELKQQMALAGEAFLAEQRDRGSSV